MPRRRRSAGRRRAGAARQAAAARRVTRHTTCSRARPSSRCPAPPRDTLGGYSPTISPFVEDEDAVGEREDLLERERDKQDRPALVALLDEAAVDELGRTDVQAARRLGGEQDAWVAGDLACDDDLLLVSARERRGAGRRGAAADVELLQELTRAREQPLGLSQPKREAGALAVVVQAEVLCEGEVEDEAPALAVLGDVPDAGVENLARARVRRVLRRSKTSARSAASGGR